jgi:membrane-bound lytic murein transglycosylase B
MPEEPSGPFPGPAGRGRILDCARSAASHHDLLMPAPPSPPPRRVRAIGAAVALGLVAGALAAAAPAHAEHPVASSAAAPTAPAAPLAPPSPELPGLPATAIELAQVPVGGPDFERASEAYREVAVVHADAQAARHALDLDTSSLAARTRELEAVRASAKARVAGLTVRLEAVERAIQQLAVETFVAGNDQDRLNEAITSDSPATNDAERRDVLAGATMDVLLNEREAYRARIESAMARADTAATELAKARERLDGIADDRAPAVQSERARAAAVAEERVAYEEARVLAQVQGVEFPLVALDAYYRAAEALATERPECGVQWWGIAGISRVEGRHGTYGGTELLPNGDTSKRIIGIQLNGTNSTAVIGDTDDGALDGDPSYDRAVGPMQFIPETWRRFEADGNEDGTVSPFNLYDATLAAASYLCTASGGLRDDPGLRAAYFSYNHSVLYVESVLGYARLYERSIEVPERRD